jgi:CubicO group peptidase (beta-lactamase class C family)
MHQTGSDRVGGLSQGRLRRLHDILAARVESGAVPGLVALVDRGGETHAEVMGTLSAGGRQPVRRDTIFRMASATKPVIAAAVMMLVEEGRLRLDDPVDPWLPELADRRVLRQIDGPVDDTVPAVRPLILRDLLTFTWGFGMLLGRAPADCPIQVAVRESGIGGETVPAGGADEWIARLGALPLMYQPGERWLYGTGADVLGILVARITGQSLGAFLAERVFDPLGMTDTGFYVPSGSIGRLPTSYAHHPQTGELVVWDDAASGHYSKPPAFEQGARGLVSTVDDYLAFYRMLLNHGMHNRVRVLSRPSVELMTMNHLTPAQAADKDGLAAFFGNHGGWGFLMAVRTRRLDLASVGQFGWGGGLGTSTFADPAEQLTGILLTQVATDTLEMLGFIGDFWTAAYQAIDG